MSSVATSPRTSTLLSAGPILFAPDPAPDGAAVLFVADVTSASIHAFELPAESAAPNPDAPATPNIDALDTQLASLLGVAHDDVVIRGIAVHPVSHDVFLSVARGRGAEAGPALVRVSTSTDATASESELSVVELDGLASTVFELDDAPAAGDDQMDFWLDGHDPATQSRDIHGVTLAIAQVPARRSTITDLAWVDGSVFVAGLSNEEFSSRLRQIPYPFDGSARETSVEIFHVDHGTYETQSPIRALTAFDGGASILATYTCTPVVSFAVSDLTGSGLVRGRTVAELGPMNQPFSIVSYDRDGEEFLLVSNTRHPLLKIPASSIDAQSHLDLPLSDPAHSVGVPREELDHPGVTWMASLDRGHVVVVQESDGELNLRTLSADVL